MGKGVVFYDDSDRRIMSSTRHPGHVVASLDKTLYDNYLCLVALNKPANLRGKKSKRQQESLENGQLLCRCGFVQNIAPVIGG